MAPRRQLVENCKIWLTVGPILILVGNDRVVENVINEIALIQVGKDGAVEIDNLRI